MKGGGEDSPTFGKSSDRTGIQTAFLVYLEHHSFFSFNLVFTLETKLNSFDLELEFLWSLGGVGGGGGDEMGKNRMAYECAHAVEDVPVA